MKKLLEVLLRIAHISLVLLLYLRHYSSPLFCYQNKLVTKALGGSRSLQDLYSPSILKGVAHTRLK